MCWGGANNAAQAIWKVRATRTEAELAEFLSKLRVFDILGQDDAGAWIAKTFPDLMYIRATKVYGWQPSDEYLDEHIQNHGPLGAVSPDRKYASDAIDARIIEEVRTSTATKGDKGFVANADAAGGWIEMKPGTALPDADKDGMSDDWETRFGLDPTDAADSAQELDKDGYTNIEESLNGTDPTVFIDYTQPAHNINTLH